MSADSALDALNERLGNDSEIRFEAGPKTLQKAVLRVSEGASAEVFATGAHVTSWRTAAAGEFLYLSPSAEIAPGKSIRGGIPLVFPQFGPGLLPSHGFARSSLWTFERTLADRASASITLALESTDESRKLWPYDFRAEYTVTLSPATLELQLSIMNGSDRELFFQCALHTYFRVGDISSVSITGLRGKMFLDNLKSRQVGTEHRDRIAIDGEVDRIYLQANGEIVIDDPSLKRRISIHSAGLPDAVLWNPWIEKEKAMKDLTRGGHRTFVCVENGVIGAPVRLLPGGRFDSSVRYCC